MQRGSATFDVLLPPPRLPPDGGDFGDGGGGSNDRGGSRRASFAALIVLVGTTSMVFAAFTGAYLARRNMAEDWIRTPLPRVLWLNSLVILAGSGAVELARHWLHAGRRSAFNRWWTAGTACGVLFLVGQAAAWRQLHAAGIYVASNPSSSFFFLLTAAHGVHLLGAVAALVYVDVRALRYELGPARRTAADVTALFCHFLAALWVYLLLLFAWMG